MDSTRQCGMCMETFELNEENFYSFQRNGKTYFKRTCKTCYNAAGREWKKNNKEKVKSGSKEYYANNREKVLAASIKWKRLNPDKAREIKTRCYDKEKTKDYRGEMFKAAKMRAKRDGRLFEITRDDIVKVDVCPILGIKLEPSKGKGPSDSSPTLDRIDDTKGYIKGNVQVVSYLANRMKSNATPDQLLMFAEWVTSTYKATGRLLPIVEEGYQ
jgi:hypothetical protein